MMYSNRELLKNLFVFDIETIPDVSLACKLCNGMSKNPENETEGIYTEDEIDKLSIFEKEDLMIRYHKEKHNNEFLRQPFHKISCISFLIAEIEYNDFGKEKYVFKKLESCSCFENVKEEKTEYSCANGDERRVIKYIWNVLERYKPRIVSFNGKIFDINVLKCKALKYGIDCGWYFEYGGKWDGYEYPYANSHFDVLGKYGAYNLHEMCIMLNIPCKLGIDGSRVSSLYYDEKYREICEYCETDVLATYLIYLRMALAQGVLDRKEYNKCIVDIENDLIKKQDKKKGLKDFLDAWYKLNPSGITLEEE